MLRFKVVANVPQGKSTLWYGYEEAVWSQGKHAKATYTTPEMIKRYTYQYQHVMNHVSPAPRLLQSHPVFPPLSFRCTPSKPASDSAPRTYVLILQSSWRKILCVTCCHYCLWNLEASRRSLMHFGSSWIKPSARIYSPTLWNIPIAIVSLFRIFPVLAAKAHHHADRIRFLLWWTGCFHVKSDGLRGLLIGVQELQFRDPEHAQHTLSRWADGPLQPVASHLLGWIKLKLLNDNSKPVEKLLLALEICRGSEGFHQPWDPAHRFFTAAAVSWGFKKIPEFLLFKDWRKVWQKHPRQKQREKIQWQETQWVPVNSKRTTRKPQVPTTFTCRFFSAAASTGGISNHPDGAFVLTRWSNRMASPTKLTDDTQAILQDPACETRGFAMLLYCYFRDFKSLAARLLVWPNYGQQVKVYKVWICL